MKRRRRGVASVFVAALIVGVATILAAGSAWAHVIVQPGSLQKGASDVIFSFSTPNETDSANVTQLEIDFPAKTPLLSAYGQAKPGWTTAVETTKLPKPITTDDGQISEVVSKITWTATAGGIPPHQFDLFTVSVGQLPAKAKSLEFKALQTSSDGSIVRWIEDPAPKGAPQPEHPAPILKLTGKAPKG